MRNPGVRFFFHIVARFNTLRPRAARSAWEGGPPQAPRRRLAAEAAQAAEPVEVLLWPGRLFVAQPLARGLALMRTEPSLRTFLRTFVSTNGRRRLSYACYL